MNAWASLVVIYAAVFISSPLIAIFHVDLDTYDDELRKLEQELAV